ncbi:MAG: pilin [Pseudomonadota bacterium]
MRRLTALLATFTLTLTACSSNPTSALKAADTASPIAPAWLGNRVPDDALAYVRIPSFLGLTSSPKDNALGPFLASDTHTDWLNSVLDGLANNVATKPGFEAQAIQWLLRHQRSAIEVMISPVPGAGGTAPGIVLVMQTDINSNTQMNQALSSLLAETVPGVGMPAGLDEDGIGVITGAPVPAIVGFDANAKRMMILAGAGASVERMQTARQALAAIPQITPMSKMQSRIDDSGYGMFAWVNTKNALAMGQMMIPPQYMEPVIASGLDQAESIAFGYGVSNGKTRMSFLADVPQGNGLRSLIPVPNNQLGLSTTAPPDGLLVMSLPTLAEAKAIALATGSISDSEWTDYAATATEMLGTDIEALYSVLSGELLYVTEPVGSYSALAVGNGNRVDTMFSDIAEKFDLTFETRRVRGLDIRHFKIPTMPNDELLDAVETASGDPAVLSFLSIYANIGTHLFWVYDDGYMIFANTPQVLIDRHNRGTTTQLSDWANGSQNQDLTKTLLGGSVSVEGLPRFAHQAYLSSMPFLSDIAGLDLDIWSLPTGDDLNLPEKGAISFGVITADDLLGTELSFEHSPVDIIGGASGAMTGAFVVGIAAAVAIPAYQDYQMRAKVAGALSLAAATKTEVAEFVLTNNRLPGEDDVDRMNTFRTGVADSLEASVTVQPDSGAIVVRMTGRATPLNGRSLVLTPQLYDGVIVEWTCSSDAEPRYLPASCREPSLPDSREVNKTGQ